MNDRFVYITLCDTKFGQTYLREMRELTRLFPIHIPTIFRMQTIPVHKYFDVENKYYCLELIGFENTEADFV